MDDHNVFQEDLHEELRGVRLSPLQKAALKQQMLAVLKHKSSGNVWNERLCRFWHTTFEVPMPIAALCLAVLLIASSLSANLLDSSPVHPPAVVQIEEMGANGVTTIRVIPGR